LNPSCKLLKNQVKRKTTSQRRRKVNQRLNLMLRLRKLPTWIGSSRQ